MPSGNQPSVRLRRIGSALRKARESSGLTIGTASRRYGRSQGWLSTLENGLHTVEPQELADLLDFYGVPEGPLRESLLHLVTRSPAKNWDRVYEGRVSAAALDLASLEEDSGLIRSFQTCVIPGLLQLPDYHRALIAVGSALTIQNADALVAFRVARQGILTRANPTRYVAVITESVLHHQVGSPAVMRNQLRHLSNIAQLEHVELRVLPNSAAAHLWLAGPFDLLALRPPGRLTVSVVDQFTKGLFIEDEHEVAAHEAVFARLIGASLDENRSLELVRRIASAS